MTQSISALCVFAASSSYGLACSPGSAALRSQLGATLVSFAGLLPPESYCPVMSTAVLYLPGDVK